MSLILISIFSILIPIGVGIWRHSRLETEVKLLLYLLIPVALNQFLSIFWQLFIAPNNIPFFHIYIFIELIVLSWIFFLYLSKTRIKGIIPLIAIGFSLFYVTLIIIYPSVLENYEVAAKIRALEGVIVLLYVVLYFIDIYRKQQILSLQKTAGFWISGGLLLYFLSNILLFAFSELVFSQESAVFKSLWAVHAVLLVLLYFAFTIAFLCKKTETIS